MGNIVSGLTFPAIRGIQAGTEYYIVMCPLKRLKKIFTFDEAAFSPENRAQRVLNLNRIPQITKYIHQNRSDYTFSSLTACIEGNTLFESIHAQGHGSKIGNLHVDADAEFYLTDGQHRSAAISRALEEDPTLGDETISVVFFVNKNLKQRQKVFRDLNLYPVKTSKSTAVLYGDSPEELLTNKVAKESSFFNGVIDFSENSISARSAKLFKHSSLFAACLELTKDINNKNWEAKAKKSIMYWDALASNLPLWQQAKAHQIRPQDRAHYVLFTAILLKCFAILGRELLANHKNWKSLLKKFQGINWDRSNSVMWDRRCFNNGRMAHNNAAAILTVNALKQHLGLALTAEQQKMEDKFLGANNES
ncbi:DNA sulfur modification protein DndB [Idiomarina sp. A28L]|uniref:DNA sulfur modification protein DndB n=1 Tax=Idiomarina sp. A28L TaxID=1036674 RepID=UPI00021385FE|nr:DNA sulfur modification protein DndB [Idiomarina sp. A28L]EGN74183.1 DNA sulfur modification protein DndB [Idiomarina sp. A28L]